MAALGTGIIISGGTTSMSDLDEVMIFASVSLASSKSVTLKKHKPLETIVASTENTKTGA